MHQIAYGIDMGEEDLVDVVAFVDNVHVADSGWGDCGQRDLYVESFDIANILIDGHAVEGARRRDVLAVLRSSTAFYDKVLQTWMEYRKEMAWDTGRASR